MTTHSICRQAAEPKVCARLWLAPAKRGAGPARPERGGPPRRVSGRSSRGTTGPAAAGTTGQAASGTRAAALPHNTGLRHHRAGTASARAAAPRLPSGTPGRPPSSLPTGWPRPPAPSRLPAAPRAAKGPRNGLREAAGGAGQRRGLWRSSPPAAARFGRAPPPQPHGPRAEGTPPATAEGPARPPPDERRALTGRQRRLRYRRPAIVSRRKRYRSLRAGLPETRPRAAPRRPAAAAAVTVSVVAARCAL